MNTFSGIDYDGWWNGLTFEQKRAAYEAATKSQWLNTRVYEPSETTTHSNIPLPNVNVANVVDYDEIRKQLASKVVWDQDRFKPHSQFRPSNEE